jgi:hypothetical protein
MNKAVIKMIHLAPGFVSNKIRELAALFKASIPVK